MKFHIVGNGESIEDILNGYDITFDELKNENKHIRIWHNLIPGTKLKIPVLTETIIEEINEVEPFIEDYYPKIKVEEEPYTLVEEETEVVIPFNNPIEEINEPVIIESNNNINENESNINEKIIESVKEENTERDYNMPNNKQLYVRYVYPPMYYRPIIYIIPKNKRTH